jgi:hypothetical protein
LPLGGGRPLGECDRVFEVAVRVTPCHRQVGKENPKNKRF